MRMFRLGSRMRLCSMDRSRVSGYLRALGANAMRVQDAGVSKSGATVGREAIFSNFLVVARVE